VIVFCGIPSEAPLQAAIAAAERRQFDYVVFNQREAQHFDLCFESRGASVDGILRVQERDVRISDVCGVYLRSMDVDDLPEHKIRGRWSAEPLEVRRSRVVQSMFAEWLEVAQCRVLNRPGQMLSNMSKAYQALSIRRCGFRIPATIITNDPNSVRRFVDTHGRVIYKSASAARSIVREFTTDCVQDLERVRNLPTQFQQHIPGVDVRVHTVGRRYFAAEIKSEVVDYRYAAREGASVSLNAIDLPARLAEQCISLATELNLPLAGIDLKRTPEGDYYCFEVNPSPAYTYYEEHTGQPIAAAIAEYLATGD
jgi:glutathione synthase/RimK-type ligase-like ATP-grasp enzyme